MTLNAHEFLVAERDDDFYKDNPHAFKRIFKIDLSAATDLENVQSQGNCFQDPEQGLLIDGLTLEQYVLQQGWEGLAQQGIYPVNKTLLVDLIEQLQYPHDKVEGLWRIDQQHLAILNDDDYAFSEHDGVIQQKYLDQAKTVIDGNRLYIVSGLDLNT